MESKIHLVSEESNSSASSSEISLPQGSSRVRLRLVVPRNARLTVDLEAYNEEGQILGRRSITLGKEEHGVKPPVLPRSWNPHTLVTSLSHGFARAISGLSVDALTRILIWASLGLYIMIRLIGLSTFPIYFFTDEAVQTVLAGDFLRDGLRSSTGEVLPTFFQNGSQYNLGASVYLQVIPYFFFGKSIWVTRGVAALATLIAAASVGLILKNIFKIPYPWLGVLFLSITPVWFLHSRTAFETALATTFYAAFLYCYLMYRSGQPLYLYGAVGFGALTFYTYSPARVVILVTGLLLFLSDFPFHWSQRKVVLAGFGLALFLALPYIRFLSNHPEANAWQMRLLGSAWVLDIPLLEKIKITLGEYLHGLSPLYWYLPHNLDLPRHTMRDYGHLLRITLPLGLLGIGMAVRHIRSYQYRTLVVAILAAPAGAALVRLGVTRALTMVIPMAILTALGASLLLDWGRRRWDLSPRLLSLGVFVVLAAGNLYMLGDSLVNGPLWYRAYSLTGMQYGARQVFGEVARYLEAQPNAHIVLSPSWANGTDVIARFFFRDPLPFELGSAEGYYRSARPQAENQLFIMIPEEFQQLPGDLFSSIDVEKVLSYPDGQAGFYFVRLTYAPDIEQKIAREEAERRQPDSIIVSIQEEAVPLSFTKLDMGEIAHLFDGDPHTLVRTDSVNPMQLLFEFPAAHSWQSLTLRIGGTATRLMVQAWIENQPEPVEIVQQYQEAPRPRDVRVDLPEGKNITRLKIELLNANDSSEGHVHLWEVTFR